jgi:hypothetical protein
MPPVRLHLLLHLLLLPGCRAAFRSFPAGARASAEAAIRTEPSLESGRQPYAPLAPSGDRRAGAARDSSSPPSPLRDECWAPAKVRAHAASRTPSPTPAVSLPTTGDTHAHELEPQALRPTPYALSPKPFPFQPLEKHMALSQVSAWACEARTEAF